MIAVSFLYPSTSTPPAGGYFSGQKQKKTCKSSEKDPQAYCRHILTTKTPHRLFVIDAIYCIIQQCIFYL
jgi:hypothetical protein